VAVVIATRDRPALLEGALDALARHTRPEDEVVVVDSASVDRAVGRLVEDAGVRLVRVDVPGTSRARNAGVAATSAPVLAFLDDDCLAQPGWTAAIEANFAAEPRLGFLTGRVDGDRDARLPLSVVTGGHRRAFVQPCDPVAFGAGANMAFRRVAFEAVGGFDEHLGPGARLRAGEDPDLLWRIVRAGWLGAYDPDVAVVHQQWRTDARALAVAFSYGVGGGAFAAKVIRLGERRGWAFLGDRLWRRGVRKVGEDLRLGYQAAAASDLLRALGTAAGAAASLRLSVRDGRFSAR
jgi:glycosyltransferase involved in cell wall biosynthesis